MISYLNALKKILKNRVNLPNEKILTSKSLDRVTAKNIYSPCNYPSANNTAFDGFALVSKETRKLKSNKKKKFKVIKTIAAGDNPNFGQYKTGTTIEIMTGGIVPKPFDSVIPVELTTVITNKNKKPYIMIDQKIKKYSHIRFEGSDYKKKDLVIKKGEIIQPKHLMAFSTLGIKNVLVKKKPKILLISTGSELIKKSQKKILPWKIRNSNNDYISALNNSTQSEIIDGGIIKDNEKNKLKKIFKKIYRSKINIFITSGAVSAGKFDFIPEITKEIGLKNIFKNVAIRPGKPILFSKFKNKAKLFFGLPGNPISSAACFRFFVYPLIRSSLGLKQEKKIKAKLKTDFVKKKPFTRFLKGELSTNKKGINYIKILEGQQSFRILSFTKSNAWAIFYAGKEKYKKGEYIDCLHINPQS